MIKLGITDLNILKDKKVFEEGFGLLPSSRQEKVLKMKQESGKRQSLGAFLLFMKMLRDFSIDVELVQKEKIRIKTDSFGKPYLEGMDNIFFSLSHSGDYALCVMSDEKTVGCDIEIISERCPDGVAQRFYSEKEQLMIEKAEDKADCFYRIWTKKESFIKAIGMGLSCPLDAFFIDSADNGRVISDRERIIAEAIKHNPDFEVKLLNPDYYVKNYDIAKGYMAAVCTTDRKMPEITDYNALV